MTIHLISVGISLFDNLRNRERRPDDQPGLARRVDKAKPWDILGDQAGPASEWLVDALAEVGSGGQRSARATELAGMTERIRPGLWPSRLSAELDTFERDPKAKRPLPDKDIAVLVSSDTADGLAAGLWNAVALVDGDLSRVRYLTDPADPIGQVRGKAVLVRVPGLDAGDERGFRDAMRGLGLLGRSLRFDVATPEDEPFRCYLSGGFKAAIPYLIGLAEGLRSLPGIGQVDAVVLHEVTRSAPIKLPLRRIGPGLVREELAGFDANGCRRQPSKNSFLEGYAYETLDDGSTQRLTAFGEGLRALFGLSPEVLGG
ncbi:MAG: hypothetical protein ACRDT0_02210 [Pseudonocardiaceae bacterium]